MGWAGQGRGRSDLQRACTPTTDQPHCTIGSRGPPPSHLPACFWRAACWGPQDSAWDVGWGSPCLGWCHLTFSPYPVVSGSHGRFWRWFRKRNEQQVGAAGTKLGVYAGPLSLGTQRGPPSCRVAPVSPSVTQGPSVPGSEYAERSIRHLASTAHCDLQQACTSTTDQPHCVPRPGMNCLFMSQGHFAVTGPRSRNPVDTRAS